MKVISENIKSILALIIVIGAFSYLFMITLINDDDQILSQALIAVVTALSGATGYYFGYSQGAAKKDEVLSTMASQPTVTQADTVNVNNSTTTSVEEEVKG